MKNGSNKKAGTGASHEEYAVLPDDLLSDIARLKGRSVPQKDAPVASSILYPVTAAIKKAEEEIVAALSKDGDSSALIGRQIEGRGVFIGTWQPEGLSQKFNIFAAPEDLTNENGEKELYTYKDAVTRIAELKDWHGFDGTNYADDSELYRALKNRNYNSGWFIPPSELLTGKLLDGETIQPDNLYDYREKGSLSGSFCTGAAKAYSADSGVEAYWSSTEDVGTYAWWADFLNGRRGWGRKEGSQLSCRPVRLEAVI
jgi:hypothetical protein